MNSNFESSLPEKDYGDPKTLPSVGVQSVPHERIVTSEGSRPTTNVQSKPLVSVSNLR